MTKRTNSWSGENRPLYSSSLPARPPVPCDTADFPDRLHSALMAANYIMLTKTEYEDAMATGELLGDISPFDCLRLTYLTSCFQTISSI